MNKELLESQWVQIKDILHEKFSNLSDEDIRQINGRYEQLVAKLQQKYGYTREEAEERIRNWNFDRFATTSSTSSVRNPVIRDERIERETDNSSFYKWLLGLGIPLLLLGAYFFNTRPLDTATTTRQSTGVYQEQQISQETPADRFISTGLRNALVSQQNVSFALQNVQITTHDGVVTLSGTVPSAEARDTIVTAAQNYAGVRQVVNHIEVR